MGINGGDKRSWVPPAAGIAVASSLYFTGGGKAFIYSFNKGLRKYILPPDDQDPDGTGFGGGMGVGSESRGGFDVQEFAIDATLGLMVAGLFYMLSRKDNAHA